MMKTITYYNVHLSSIIQKKHEIIIIIMITTVKNLYIIKLYDYFTLRISAAE